MDDMLTMILAGGKGTRLEPLTRDRAKPAVPFGGQYRIIDFVLSNCINSYARKILVLTQFKSASLDRHINGTWHFLNRDLGEFIETIPPQQRINENWYMGTADAIYQNIYSIERVNPKRLLILGGDHIYKMNYGYMLDFHIRNKADLTIGCLPVSLTEAARFGVMQVDESHRVTGFREKPDDPDPMPGDPSQALASMGIYIFDTDMLLDRLYADAGDPHSQHDFGADIIPQMIRSQRVFAYPFCDEHKRASYWRDVGTLEEYYACNLDLAGVSPKLNLYDEAWPIRTRIFQDPPAKFVFADEATQVGKRRGEAHDSIVCPGSVISGGHVERSILSRQVRVNSFATVEDSILFEGVNVGRHCKIRKAIIDKGVTIPEGTEVGYDADRDRARGFLVLDDGVTVIAKAETEEAFV